MSLKTTWNRSDTSNLIIDEDLQVRYSAEETYYDVPPKGDPSKAPSYVTQAEQAVSVASAALDKAIEEREALTADLSAKQSASDTAYRTWYNDQTYGNYINYLNARRNLYAVRVQVNDKNIEIEERQRVLKKAETALTKANEQWAIEREDVYYTGARLLGYLYHRYASMRFHYVGFSKEAATRCVEALNAYLTRSITKSAVFYEGEVEELTMAYNPSSVKMTKGPGDNYSVEVEVREDDVHAATTNAEPATLFAEENARFYRIWE